MTGWALAGAGAGAIIGSFLATLIVRWPQGGTLGGRSACDACGRTLTPRELVPLLSALLNRWRCRTCHASIERVHGQVEASCALVGLIALTVAPGWPGIAGAAFGWLLVTLAWLDAREFWLPDRLTAALAGSGLVVGIAGVPPAVFDRTVGGLVGFASLWLIAMAYRSVRGHDGLGGGDAKLFGAIGLWLGWQALPFVLVIASFGGLVVVAIMMAVGRKVDATTALPFGTFLCAGAFVVWLISAAGWLPLVPAE